MPRMIDMIRQSAVPANLMRTASRGALALPAPEMLEILVHLSSHPMFGAESRMTLASWDETSGVEVVADPAAPMEVLDYFLAPQNLRPALLPALLENPPVEEGKIALLTQQVSRDLARLFLKSPRVRRSSALLELLKLNQNLDMDDHAELSEAIASLAQATNATGEDPLEEELTQYEVEHAAEIAAEEGKRFELVRGDAEELDELADLLPLIDSPAGGAESAVPTPAPVVEQPSAATAAVVFAAHAAKKSEEHERISTLQKIARMSVGDRVQLAMKGTKDERFILIRDGSKVVCLAVLESPKLSNSEVEMFAGMKNVQENVLRGIAAKRKFIKSYAVVRALANNPRVPLDLSLPLLGHLLVTDLKNVSMNKNVSDTLRKLALKMFKEKSSTRKQ